MAKTKSRIDMATVDSLKGILDFYPRGNETIIRTWPRNKGASQTPRSVEWQRVFACFHRTYTGWWIGGPPSIHPDLLGKAWNSRDYTMWLYYGKAPKPPELELDTREPWPPMCPDPLGRFAIYNQPVAAYTLFGALHIVYSRHPPGSDVIWVTHRMPRYARRYATRRGVRHEIGSAIAPGTGLFHHAAGRVEETAHGTNHGWWYQSLGQLVYFFIVPNTGWYFHTVSISSWYVARVKPGPGGGWWGHEIEGPYPLTPYHIDHPDRPLG